MFMKILALEPPKTFTWGNANTTNSQCRKNGRVEIDYCNGFHTRDCNTNCGARNPIHLFKNGKSFQLNSTHTQALSILATTPTLCL